MMGLGVLVAVTVALAAATVPVGGYDKLLLRTQADGEEDAHRIDAAAQGEDELPVEVVGLGVGDAGDAKAEQAVRAGEARLVAIGQTLVEGQLDEVAGDAVAAEAVPDLLNGPLVGAPRVADLGGHDDLHGLLRGQDPRVGRGPREGGHAGLHRRGVGGLEALQRPGDLVLEPPVDQLGHGEAVLRDERRTCDEGEQLALVRRAVLAVHAHVVVEVGVVLCQPCRGEEARVDLAAQHVLVLPLVVVAVEDDLGNVLQNVDLVLREKLISRLIRSNLENEPNTKLLVNKVRQVLDAGVRQQGIHDRAVRPRVLAVDPHSPRRYHGPPVLHDGARDFAGNRVQEVKLPGSDHGV
eukprot:CAMPEP_0113682628 /NCGR_PEP_ID=MMETSP0038_2-20120614/12785_1 /TAXON_ID=2898 /ORGANISM="Cryptomonas paramecium" /LENGTH=351 /DNA_ID=CAMNT_0000601751 /DNA_START=104 /DNA_END=1160 /DNA_ORIENTATION=- /assembly_acc=CAM_ASM_000170